MCDECVVCMYACVCIHICMNSCECARGSETVEAAQVLCMCDKCVCVCIRVYVVSFASACVKVFMYERRFHYAPKHIFPMH